MRVYIFWLVVSVAVLLILKNPLIGVISYSIVNIVRPEMLFWGGSAGSKSIFIFYVITFISIFINYKKNTNELTENSYSCREIVLFFLIYFVFLIFMPLSDYNVEASYPYVHEIGKNVLFCLMLFLSLRTGTDVGRYELSLLAAFSFLGLWGIQQHMLGNVRLEGLGGSSWGDSNGVAAIFVLFFPVAFSLVSRSQKQTIRFFGVVSTLIILLLVFYTGSRGGFLGLVAASGMIWVKWKRKVMIAVVFVFLALIILPFVDQQYLDRLSTITTASSNDEENRDSSVSSRLVFWKAGLLLFADHPFAGVGFGAYPEAKLQYRDHFSYLDRRFLDEYFRTYNPYVTHSTYIQMLSEGGLFVVVPFLIIIFGTFLSNYKTRKTVQINEDNTKLFELLAGIEAGLVGYCTCIIFINSILFIFFPIQIIVCAKIRRILHLKNNTRKNGHSNDNLRTLPVIS